jgi:hypothetical protein
VVSILSSLRMLIGSGFAGSPGLLTLMSATIVTSFRCSLLDHIKIYAGQRAQADGGYGEAI